MSDTELNVELVQSIERLNVIWHVHDENVEILDNMGRLLQQLEANPGTTMEPLALKAFISIGMDKLLTIDSLLHLARKEFCQVASEFTEGVTKEVAEEVRDKVLADSEVMKKMVSILEETDAERIQRKLIEMLGVHDQ